MESRKLYSLSELVNFITDKIKVDEINLEQYISTTNMLPNKGGIIPADDYPTVDRVNKFNDQDVLFSNIRTYFEKVWFASFSGGASTDVLIFRSKDESLISPHYLYYLLSDKKFIDYTVLTSKGAKMPRGDKTAILKYSTSLPNILIQQKIAKILGDLDKKIEINNQINETLEAMAQAIFKSWFVDFDPVHAKAEAKAAGKDDAGILRAAMAMISSKSEQALAQMAQDYPDEYKKLEATAKAFPDAFVESELGLIPEGWEISSFGEVSKCLDSQRIPLSKPEREKKKPGDIPYYGATSIMDYINEYIFDDTYLLLGEDGSVIKENGTPFIQYIWGKSWVNNHAHVLKGINGISTEHLLLFIQQKNISAYITGAVQLKLNQRNMRSIPFVLADKKINSSFNNCIQTVFEIYKQKSEENKTLTELRDSLLPKLLSGEIEV